MKRPGDDLRAGSAFWQNSIGLKAAMSISGIVLVLFLVEHAVGNLLVYAGPATINGFAAALESRSIVWLVWIVRGVLLAAFLVHVASATILHLQKRRARPIAYHHRRNVQASAASRTMIWTGLVILAYVVYHLLHLTFGVIHPDFHGIRDTYDNVVGGLRVAGSAVAYLVGMLALGFHLWHGLYSMLPSLGWREPRYMPRVRTAAALTGTLIALAFASIPLAIVSGLIS